MKVVKKFANNESIFGCGFENGDWKTHTPIFSPPRNYNKLSP